jgi:UPF0755 protein
MRLLDNKVLSTKELITGIILFFVICITAYFYRDARLNNPSGITGDAGTVIFLYENEDLDGLIDLFREKEVRFDERNFRWASGIYGWRNFLPGRYDLTGRHTYESVLVTLANGLQTPGNIIIHAGQWEERFIQRVAAQMRFTEEELREALHDSVMLENHGIREHQIFGRMLPNTYEIYWTSTAGQFVERILSEFDRLAVQPNSERFEEVNMNIDEITTLASIIEWEARHDHEKARISGLYWNRLRSGWRLQADPTVIYAVGERRRLFNSDYRVQHPYNTYRNHGLPPGPLNNPALSSINAALQPEDHDYYFMVATPEGVHTFTRTYAEHQRESRKWQQFIREQTEIRLRREHEAAAQAAESNGK